MHHGTCLGKAARSDHGQAKLFKVVCWFGEPPVVACRACTFRRIGIPGPLTLPGAGIVVAAERRFLGRKIPQAWFRKLLIPQRGLKGGSRSAGGIEARGGLARLMGGLRPGYRRSVKDKTKRGPHRKEYLCISGVCIEYVREEFTSAGHTCND